MDDDIRDEKEDEEIELPEEEDLDDEGAVDLGEGEVDELEETENIDDLAEEEEALDDDQFDDVYDQ